MRQRWKRTHGETPDPFSHYLRHALYALTHMSLWRLSITVCPQQWQSEHRNRKWHKPKDPVYDCEASAVGKNNTTMASHKSWKQIRLQNTTVVETYQGAKVTKYNTNVLLSCNRSSTSSFVCVFFFFMNWLIAAVAEAYLVLSDHVQTRIESLVWSLKWVLHAEMQFWKYA